MGKLGASSKKQWHILTRNAIQGKGTKCWQTRKDAKHRAAVSTQRMLAIVLFLFRFGGSGGGGLRPSTSEETSHEMSPDESPLLFVPLLQWGAQKREGPRPGSSGDSDQELHPGSSPWSFPLTHLSPHPPSLWSETFTGALCPEPSQRDSSKTRARVFTNVSSSFSGPPLCPLRLWVQVHVSS